MSTRIQKVNELIRAEIARIISREIEFPDALVTIMRAETEADCKRAKIFISVTPKTHEKGAIATLKKRKPFLQHQLNRTLAMHFVPSISFGIEKEETENLADEVDHILDQIKRES
ncbi:ribosome-binding factor A [Candidatus Uhrbacteria bacterium]|nr:ribosome-binding factor A [Candidatus Uhrbacteria bacterium]